MFMKKLFKFYFLYSILNIQHCLGNDAFVISGVRVSEVEEKCYLKTKNENIAPV